MKFVTVCFGLAVVTLVGCQPDSSSPATAGGLRISLRSTSRA